VYGTPDDTGKPDKLEIQQLLVELHRLVQEQRLVVCLADGQVERRRVWLDFVIKNFL
jgi:hypothetical protein